jgi:hypothetical protein
MQKKKNREFCLVTCGFYTWSLERDAAQQQMDLCQVRAPPSQYPMTVLQSAQMNSQLLTS